MSGQKTVVAKFKCQSVENYEHGKRAKLSAVYGTEGENKDFTNATPAGQIDISISRDVPASEFFEPGKYYYVNFTEAEKK